MTSSGQTLPKKPPLNHTTPTKPNLTDGTALIPCLPLQEPIHVVDSLWRQGGLLCALATYITLVTTVYTVRVDGERDDAHCPMR